MNKLEQILDSLEQMNDEEVREVRLAIIERFGHGDFGSGDREPLEPKSPVLAGAGKLEMN